MNRITKYVTAGAVAFMGLSLTTSGANAQPLLGGLIDDLGVDLCPTVDGIQLDAQECKEEGDLGVDLCPALEGIQLDLLDCEEETVEVDVCPALDGIQLNILECNEPIAVDVCLNIPGIQLDPLACPGDPGNPGGPGDPGGPSGPQGPIGGGADPTTLGAINGPQVCFFTGQNYTGDVFCAAGGAVYVDLGRWNDRIRSILVPPGMWAEVCSGAGQSGQCTAVTTSLPVLYGGWDLAISSLLVAA